MKRRISLSVDTYTAAYLADRARAETNGNVSALVDRIVRHARLTDAAERAAGWYATYPGYLEDAEAERLAAGSP